MNRLAEFLQGLAPTWPDLAPLQEIRRHEAVPVYRQTGTRTIARTQDGELAAPQH